MRIGFTGTRRGMTQWQMQQLEKVLAWLTISAAMQGETRQFHHGGAVGADTQADGIAFAYCCGVTVHPCPGVVASWIIRGVAQFNGHDVEMEEVFDPLVRNRHIVYAVDVLIAAPFGDVEVARSGTWATIRYAQLRGIPVIHLSRCRGRLT